MKRGSNSVLQLDTSNILRPYSTSGVALGSSSYKYSAAYASTFVGALNGIATSANKLGSSNVGSTILPIFLSAGVATAVHAPSSGQWFSSVPCVASDGVMEIGRIIDFHKNNTGTSDFDVRLDSNTVASGLECSGYFETSGLIAATTTGFGTSLPSSGVEGQIFFQTSPSAGVIATKITTTAATNSTKYYLIGASAAGSQSPYIATANGSGSQNTAGVYFMGSTGVLSGASWNDYAEYRYMPTNEIPYGRVVVEVGDDSVKLSTERLQPGGQIISDSYGFIIGPEKNSVPVALCGRVLAYPYEERDKYEPGDAVCTGPWGTVSKMTREEIREWPDRIIGYVSSVPKYEIWPEKDIKVNGRIWIKVK